MSEEGEFWVCLSRFNSWSYRDWEHNARLQCPAQRTHLSVTRGSGHTEPRPATGKIVSTVSLGFSFYLFLVALGLRCCLWAFSSGGEQGLLFVAVRRLLIAVASLVAELGL